MQTLINAGIVVILVVAGAVWIVFYAGVKAYQSWRESRIKNDSDMEEYP